MFVSDTTAGARPVSGDVFDSWRHAGEMRPFAGSSAPWGTLFPYGQAVSHTIYPYLYAAISTTYNTGGEGAGNFRLPDLRGRSIFGLDNMGGTAAGRLTGSNTGNITAPTTLGSTGGEENHTQTLAELFNHGHAATVTDPGHIHSISGGLASLGSGGASAYGPFYGTYNTSSAITGISVANANTGGGGSHNTTPPGMVCNWIIKL
jgi:microcystin-dependent protein